MKTRKLQCRIQLAASEPVAYRLVWVRFAFLLLRLSISYRSRLFHSCIFSAPICYPL